MLRAQTGRWYVFRTSSGAAELLSTAQSGVALMQPDPARGKASIPLQQLIRVQTVARLQGSSDYIQNANRPLKIKAML